LSAVDYPDAVTLPDSAHTAPEAAAAIGVEVGAIVKSLVFLRGDVPVLVLCSGANMVDADALGLAASRPTGTRRRWRRLSTRTS
jgi:prolyl-tRNA editing enzyme YbaK/EbsC (Cys-tRNA(Pro) deacylase)